MQVRIVGDVLLIEVPKQARNIEFISLSEIKYTINGRESSAKTLPLGIPKYRVIGSLLDIADNEKMIKDLLLDSIIDYHDPTKEIVSPKESFQSWIEAHGLNEVNTGLCAILYSKGSGSIKWLEKLPKNSYNLSTVLSKDNPNNLVRMIKGKKKMYITNEYNIEVLDKQGNKMLMVSNFEIIPNTYFLFHDIDNLYYVMNTSSIINKKTLSGEDNVFVDFLMYITKHKERIYIIKNKLNE